MLTRMRQLALHPGLVPANYLEQLRTTEDQGNAPPPAIRITAKDRIRLQDVLSQMIEDSEECPICFSILTDPRITACAHSFCLAWYVFGSMLLNHLLIVNKASRKLSLETPNVLW